jgi:V/A-type H+-transporting ATPase subunit E
MDVQLKELIETIKSEGVENAEAKAAEIVGEAEKKRNEIIASAEKEASEIRKKAEADAEMMKATADESIRQAGRDLILSLEASITKLLDSVVRQESASALKGEGLEKSILALLSSWNEESDSIDLLRPGDELERIEKSLLGKLSEKMKGGVSLKPAPGIDAGFRIAEKDGSAYYNFTADGIAEMLSQYVNPKLSALLRESVKSDKK